MCGTPPHPTHLFSQRCPHHCFFVGFLLPASIQLRSVVLMIISEALPGHLNENTNKYADMWMNCCRIYTVQSGMSHPHGIQLVASWNIHIVQLGSFYSLCLNSMVLKLIFGPTCMGKDRRSFNSFSGLGEKRIAHFFSEVGKKCIMFL